MLNIFKRKPETFQEYIHYIVSKPKMQFQFDVYRNNDVDYQVCRQGMIINLGIKEIDNPRDLAVVINFNANDEDVIGYLENFKKSELFDRSIKPENYGETYVIKCENNVESILTLLRIIQMKVYNYNDETIHNFSFSKF